MQDRDAATPRTPARHAAAGHDALAFGLHLVEHEHAARGPERPVGADRAGLERLVVPVGARARRHTFTRLPSTRNHAPGRGFPARTTRASSDANRCGSRRNSSTVSFSA